LKTKEHLLKKVKKNNSKFKKNKLLENTIKVVILLRQNFVSRKFPDKLTSMMDLILKAYQFAKNVKKMQEQRQKHKKNSELLYVHKQPKI
jgi:hypothetical protein